MKLLSNDHHQITFVAPKEPIRIEKVLVESPSQELKAEAKRLQVKGKHGRKQNNVNSPFQNIKSGVGHCFFLFQSILISTVK